MGLVSKRVNGSPSFVTRKVPRNASSSRAIEVSGGCDVLVTIACYDVSEMRSPTSQYESKAWRAMLESTDSNERYSFADLESLCAFLREQTGCDAQLLGRVEEKPDAP